MCAERRRRRRSAGRVFCGGWREHQQYVEMKIAAGRSIILWFFIIYPSLSARTLAMFKCRTIGETSYLNSDLYTPCPYVTLERSFQVACLCLVYPVGIPVVLFILSYRFKIPPDRRDQAG
mmetsp:Transcript_25595/g.63043  ORF Transcript_25595/g.63043 Transcript_25595/m.63043 type:complete len:120 (-) Transcript_25595:1042-1401(-)